MMYRIGIDLGGTWIAAGLVDAKLRITDREQIRTNVPRPVESMVDDMVSLVHTLLARNRLTMEQLHSLGIGVPCTANEENGHMEDANNLGFEDVPLTELLAQRLNVPVYIGNDANAAAWGEYLTGGYEGGSFLMVTLGTGIGGGIILNRRLWSGINYAAGEFGHMAIRCGGAPCTCGRTGCWEAYASATALIGQARQQMSVHADTILWQLCGGDESRVEAKSVFDGAKLGDPVCIGLLDEYTTYLAEGIANLISIFQPAYICIGGGVSKAGDHLLLPLREKTEKLIYSQNAKRNTHIVLAKLDNDAGILGAALLGS